MNIAISVCFVIAGTINLLPVAGVTSDGMLERLYGVAVTSPDLSLLLRHRAVLFGIVGSLLLAAAVVPALRTAACLAGLVSMLSFTLLAWAGGPVGNGLMRIAWIDIAASLVLCLGFGLDRLRLASGGANVV